MTFEVLPLRFHLMATDAVCFPAGKPANALRGGFGAMLKRIDEAAYTRIFKPVSTSGPSGLADPPRPFVFRARELDGRTIPAGQAFCFGVNLFDTRRETVDHFMRAIEELGRGGVGPTRGRAELVRVEGLEKKVFVFDEVTSPVTKVRVEFLTPTELKGREQIVDQPEFPVLAARIRDRVSMLSALYGAGPLAIDFTAMQAKAAEIQMTRCEIRTVNVTRLSARTGQRHAIGGFVGSAEYEGELGQFALYLEAAQWTGIGRQTVWGKGEIHVAF